MKISMFTQGGRTRVGIVGEKGLIDVSSRLPDVPADMNTLVSQWPTWRAKFDIAAKEAADFSLEDVKLLAPVPRPRKIFAIGLNYADHCAEAGMEIPKDQVWFSKAVTAVNGPFDDIELPAVSQQLDYECEMVAVIGKYARNVPKERAAEIVFGYCVGDDVSVRDWQRRTPQWVLGKSFDTHAPIGPWITTADEVGNPHELAIRSLVNGEVRQSSNTRHLVFNVYAQIEHLSKVATLEPGDLIFTGTCGGVGAAFNPPKWLKEGDRVRIEIDRLGAIENRVKAASGEPRIG